MTSKEISFVLNMIICYPQWRTIILTQEDGLERCLHFLMETHSNLFKEH